MSIVSVFAVLFLAMLLGMVMNVGRHVDGKIRMQNAADSAAYSSGVVLARGMNSLAFTNHLLCDVFALTAVLREAQAQNSASASNQILTLLEQILSEELIPQYQRAVVVAFPDIAQTAAQQTALRNGEPEYRRGPMFGVLWRTDARPVGGDAESGDSPDDRTLPVVDPELDSLADQDQYVKTAVRQRWRLSHIYLDQWNAEILSGIDQAGNMSEFARLWRSATRGYLKHLLNVEYPRKNLPMVIYQNPLQTADASSALDKHYIFISVVYWKKLPEFGPGLFKNPLEADDQAFAEVHLFIPRKRLGWVLEPPPGESGPTGGLGGGVSSQWVVGRVGGPTGWDLLNQSWDCQLAPVTQAALPTILQSSPDLPGFSSGEYQLPNLSGLSGDDLQQISPH